MWIQGEHGFQPNSHSNHLQGEAAGWSLSDLSKLGSVDCEAAAAGGRLCGGRGAAVPGRKHVAFYRQAAGRFWAKQKKNVAKEGIT